MAASRPVSPLEQKWLIAHQLAPPFAIDFVAVVEGDVHRLQSAWPVLVDRHPGLRCRLQRRLTSMRFVADGPRPPMVCLSKPGWDARTALEHPTLDAVAPAGPVAALALVETGPGRGVVVLRVHHAITDGRGGLEVLAQLFAAARSESLPPQPLPPTDYSVAQAAGGQPSRAHPPTAAAWLQGPAPSPRPRWQRTTVGVPKSPVYARLIVALARYAHAANHRPLRLTVPVDLRRHTNAPPTVANLTGLLHLDLDPLLHAAVSQPDTSPQDIVQQAIVDGVARGDHLGPVLDDFPLLRLPRAATAAARALVRRDQRTGRLPSSGTVSNLGRVPLAPLAAPGLRTTAVFVAPPVNPAVPLFMVVTGHSDRLELLTATHPSWGAPVDWAAVLTAQGWPQ